MKFKDIIKKYATRSAIIAGLVILLCAGGYSVYNMRSKLAAVRSELAAVKLDKSIVEAEKLRLDSLIIALNGSIKERDGAIAKQDAEIRKQDIEIDVLRSKVDEALAEVQETTANASYVYINYRIKPVTELKYGFDSLQVKKIHYTLVERDGLFDLNTKYNTTIKEYSNSSLLKDKQIKDLKDLNTTSTRRIEIYRKENAAYEIKVDGLNKQVKQQKFMKNVGIGATVGLVTYIIINSLAK